MSAVTNCYKLGVLQQQNLFSLTLGQISEIKMLAGLRPSKGSRGRSTLGSPRFWRLLASFWPVPLFTVSPPGFLCLPLLFPMRTLVTGFGAPGYSGCLILRSLTELHLQRHISQIKLHPQVWGVRT